MAKGQIVAVGLLTARDLEVLGASFDRCFRVVDEEAFADLLARLEEVAPTPIPDNNAPS